jgi:hypothetical protein
MRRAIVMLASLVLAVPAWGQDVAVQDRVAIELNAAQTVEGTCTLSFLVINGHAAAIERAIYEIVLFDRTGQVDLLTLFDFGKLPPARPRVRQFALPGTACEDLGQVLFNGANTCDAPTLDPGACDGDLQLGTRTSIEVSG